jgi:hypothetical protein
LARFEKKNLGNPSVFASFLRRAWYACGGYTGGRDYRICETVPERPFVCRISETAIDFAFIQVEQAHPTAIRGTAILAVRFAVAGVLPVVFTQTRAGTQCQRDRRDPLNSYSNPHKLATMDLRRACRSLSNWKTKAARIGPRSLKIILRFKGCFLDSRCTACSSEIEI